MKEKKQVVNNTRILSIGTVVFLIILLIFPTSSLAGAERGLLLWFNVICPSLLPFIIVSRLIINLRLTATISKLFYPVFNKIFAISKDGCYAAIMGLLTGLPVGAKACADLVKEGLISLKEGQYLLTFCNNASPMFIISYIGITTLKLPGSKYVFLLLIYSAAFLTGITYRFTHRIGRGKNNGLQFESANEYLCATDVTKLAQNKKITFTVVDSAIMDGFTVITKVGGYILLFSILSNVLLTMLPVDHILSYATVGILEITNGINSIGTSTLDINTKIALILSLTAFGGFSSIAQTKSVIDQSGLSIKTYIFYKLINAILTFGLVLVYLNLCML